MKTVAILVRAFLREHPARVILTSLATILSTALVVWVAGSYDSLLKSFDEWANRALGRFELSIAPISQKTDASVPFEALDALRADPAVSAVEGMTIIRTPMLPSDFSGTPAPAVGGTSGRSGRTGQGGHHGRGVARFESLLAATDSHEPPFPMLRGRWLQQTDADRQDEIVVAGNTAKQWELEVGDTVMVGREGEARKLTVCGILTDIPIIGAGAGATIRVPGIAAAFVSPSLAQKIQDTPLRIDFAGVALKPDTDIHRFRFSWAHKLSEFSTPVQFQESVEIEEALNETSIADNVRIQGYAATGVAMLIAMLIIFSTVNMGVTERVRQLAILRAVVLTRLQVGLLVILESLTLGLIGFTGGVSLGWSVMRLVTGSSNPLFRHGVSIGPNALLLAALASIGGAWIASAVPVWRAVRVRPIDAMNTQPPELRPPRRFLLTVCVGVVLVVLNPILAFIFPPAHEHQVFSKMMLGFLALGSGLVLAAPLAVCGVDRYLAPLLARLLRIHPHLFASQITSHLWRSVGATMSLAVGLGLFVGVQVWGYTMLEGFIPGRWAPDAIASVTSRALTAEDLQTLRQMPEVKAEHFTPLVFEQPRLREDLTHSAERATVTRQDNVVLLGLDMEMALRGPTPFFDFDWMEGSPEEAARLIREGRACLIPDHFARDSGLALGDSFEMVPPEKPDAPVRYTVAGIVRLPGDHLFSKESSLRIRTNRAAAMVFAGLSWVSTDFHKSDIHHVWFNYSNASVEERLLPGKMAEKLGIEMPQEVHRRASKTAPPVDMISVAEIRTRIQGFARHWIWLVSRLPLVAIFLASFGVLNVMLASVRARRWEMGVLRSVGFMRGALARAVVAEALLIGLTACLLGFGFGILAGWSGCGFAQHIGFFGGMYTSLIIPWSSLGIGFMITLLLSGLVAIWPALTIFRSTPLSLLQHGRGDY